MFYTIENVAEILKLHPMTIRRAIARGDLTVQRLGHRTVRITEQALQNYLERFTERAKYDKKGGGANV